MGVYAEFGFDRAGQGLFYHGHFDFDHVSQIPELFCKYKVDTVMLPHIAEELRVVHD